VIEKIEIESATPVAGISFLRSETAVLLKFSRGKGIRDRGACLTVIRIRCTVRDLFIPHFPTHRFITFPQAINRGLSTDLFTALDARNKRDVVYLERISALRVVRYSPLAVIGTRKEIDTSIFATAIVGSNNRRGLIERTFALDFHEDWML